MAFQYGMLMPLSIMLLAVLVPAATSVVATTRAKARQGGEEDETAMALPNCKDKCGNVTIPYPFGIGDGCYSRPEFNIICKESNDGSGHLRLMESRVIVTDIFLEGGELQTMQLVNRDCYDRQGNPVDNQAFGWLHVIPPYTVSGHKNRMFVIGCDTYAKLVGSRGNKSYTTGCISECQNNIDSNAIDKDDSCSGMGCCESKIPPLLNNLNLTMGSFTNYARVGHIDPCGYSFIVKRGNFTFSNTSFQQLRKTTRLPLVLDWQIMEESCEIAMQNNKTYACKGNSVCHNKNSGYICRCSPGYQGNPYLEDSCQDINECDSNPCMNGQCKNIPGNYTCVCDSGYHNLDNITCIEVPSTKALKISLGASLSFLVLLVVIFWKFRCMRERQIERMKSKYFESHGGLLYLEKLARTPRSAARTFTEAEIRKATDNYNESKKVGEGGYGIVYLGILDKQLVAIKKSKQPSDPIITAPATATEPSVNEMIVLSQINHKNVVRLVGCCFETRTPILVYEYIANGTLYEHIHNIKKPLSFELRLQIASEAADALAYLHHSTSTSIIHGDVKTASILLHEHFTAKVSDFGASKLVPEGENQPSTCQGTKGYLDPEKTLTKKSDVYSFGVVLAELLTSLKAVFSEKPEEESNLANVFVSKVESGLLDEILDREILEGHLKGFSEKAADLAIRCLRGKGEERPSMIVVASELQGLVRTMEQHTSGGEANITPSRKDTGNLVGSSASTRLGDDDGDGGGGSSGIITSVDSSIMQITPHGDGL